MAASFHYINKPVVNMREGASDGTKVVSQALFAEQVTIKETAGDWVKITTPDGYEGWVLFKDLIRREQIYKTDMKISRLKAHIYGVKDTEYGPIMSLPYGAGLKVLDSRDPRWLKVALLDDQECYVQKGDVNPEPTVLDKKQLPEFSKKFLGLPYTWGGRSSFGYDCSGFVQMLYGRIGVNLQRDAKQQILDPRFREAPIDALEPGDLIFFGKEKTQIRHVGMYLGDEQVIHATARENQPWIRISRLSDAEWSGVREVYYPYRTALQLIV